MASILSNNLKAIMFPGNIREADTIIRRSQCHTVQEYSYCFQRTRNDAGFPTGPTLTTILEFTIKIGSPEEGRLYYQRIHDNQPYDYTFIFNATFGTHMQLVDSEDAMVVNGYVVDVEDNYDTEDENGQSEQMLIHLKLMINSIAYIGRDHDRVLVINKK